MMTSLFLIFRYPPSFIVWVITFVSTIFFWKKYLAIDYVAANYGSVFFAYFDVALSLGVIVFFPLLLAGIVYRSLYFGRKNTKKVSGFFGVFSGIVGVFITGASCCGITLVSVFGLTSVIGFLDLFPLHGIEIKTLALCFLIYAWYDLFAHIHTCRIKK